MAMLFKLRETQDVPVLMFKEAWEDLTVPAYLIEEHNITAYYFKPVSIVRKGLDLIGYYGIAGTPYAVKLAEGNHTVGLTPAYIWDVIYGKDFIDPLAQSNCLKAA
jgi:hypothetical protein